MPVMMPGLSPDEARKAVRELSYDNTAAENQNVKRIDDAAFDLVRPYERNLVVQADSLLERAAGDLAKASKHSQAMFDELEMPLLGTATTRVDVTDAAGRYERMRADAEVQISVLERTADQAEWEADRCADPYASLNEMMTNYPALRIKGTFTL